MMDTFRHFQGNSGQIRSANIRLGVILLATGLLGCDNEIRTMDDLAKATDRAAEKAEVWQARVQITMTLENHASRWEGISYSDGRRIAALVNAGYEDARAQVQMLKDAEGVLHALTAEDDTVRYTRVDTKRLDADPAFALVLPGNVASGMPLGTFIDPRDALQRLVPHYEFGAPLRGNISGDPVLSFRGALSEDSAALFDSKSYLEENGISINEIDISLRAFNGTVRRIQFLSEGFPTIVADYYEVILDPPLEESRFEFESPEDMQPVDTTASLLASTCGVDETHTRFTWTTGDSSP